MNRVERLTGLLLVLQHGQRSAQDLANRFEVSRRTIFRDLDALAEIGVPLVATAGRAGGFRVQDGYWMPPLHLSLDETAAVLFALDNAEDARGKSPLGEAHDTARAKIEHSLGPELRSAAEHRIESIEIARSHTPANPQMTDLILAAIAERQWVRARYRGARGESTRSFLPISLTVSNGKWYVRAVDELREATRLFRIDRMVEAHRTLAPAGSAHLVDLVLATEGTYEDVANPEVLVRLTDIGIILALDHPDFHKRLVRQDGKTLLRFHCPAGELAYYGAELLRFGINATILAPDELKAMMVDQAMRILHHHQGTRETLSRKW